MIQRESLVQQQEDRRFAREERRVAAECMTRLEDAVKLKSVSEDLLLSVERDE